MPVARAIACAAIFAAAGAAQTPATPAFDVASVRAAQAGSGRGGRGMGMLHSANIRVAPGSLTMRGVSFRSLVRWAYKVQDPQVAGPDWIDQQRYDIVAKAPEQATEDQLRVMLQTLLAERFQLAVHHQAKEAQAWVLTVGKNGPKVKESTGEGDAAIEPDLQRMQVAIHRTPMSDLVDLLTQILRAPVIDDTGLKGKYDLTVEMSKYVPDPGTPVDPISTILTAIQQELGLKVESKKTSLDYVVIDKAERNPVEN